jgi:uncharacterized protein
MQPPPPDWVYYVGGALLLLGNLGAWFATLFMLPGNWLIVAFAGAAAYFLPEQPETGLGFGWVLVAVLGGLALLGEFVEFFGSASKAKLHGASRRSMVLSIIFGMLGAAVGAVVGGPLTLVGGVVLILVGAAAGAFVGTYLGETWKGRTGPERWAVSRAALVGRLFGTAGKLIVGMAMVALTAMASFYF